MSLILKFETEEDREKFLDLVQRNKPDLLPSLTSNPILPHVYARTNPKQDAWLRDHVARFGTAFEDLRFRTFAAG